jgi:drug/metabolite transporter (DMT)-like permease
MSNRMDGTSFALLVACNVLGGASYAAAAAALTSVDPYSLVLLRLAGAVPLFLPWMISHWPRNAGAAAWKSMLAVGTLGYALPLYLGTVGQDLSTTTKAALLVGVEPVSVVLLSALLLGEKLSSRAGLSILFSLTGAALIVGRGAAGASEWRGDIILAVHGFCWALYTVLGKRALREVDPLAFTGIVNAVGAAALAAALPWKGVALPSGGESWAALIFLTVVVTFMVCLGWNTALKRVPASAVAPFIFLQPLVGAGLGLWRGEPLTLSAAAGGGLILLGVALTASRRP